jgi:hypothetical protein
MLSKQEEQAERRRVLANDLSVRQQQQREQASTYLAQTHIDDAGGRFASVNAASIVGANPIPNYPAAAAHQADPCGQEPPLGYAIDAMPALEPTPTVVASPPSVATDPTSDATPLRGVGSLSRNYRRF